MISPSKHLPVDRTLLASGAELLTALHTPRTVSELWEHVRGVGSVPGFDVFCLALAMLFALGAVDLDGDILRRRAT